MTIKQQGGIFGRNPTFNDVDAASVDINSGAAGGSPLTLTTTASGHNIDMTDSTSTARIRNVGGRLHITADVNNEAASSSIRFYVDNARMVDINDSGNIVFNSAGQGIDFSATSGTGTSELFDDYEEGTWTPAFTASGGGAASHSRQNGRYTKIGNTVFAYFQLSASKGTLSGNVSISGLPFTSLNLNGLDAGSVSFNRVQRFATTFNPYGHVTGDSTSIGLFKGNTNESTDATSDGVPLDAADLNTASTFRNYCFGVAIYHTA